jgi:hypothetical protein
MKSIVNISDNHVLEGWVRENAILKDSIGKIEYYYYPFFDPMKSRYSSIVKNKVNNDDSELPYSLKILVKNQGDKCILYGPYRPLPVIGRYRVEFRLMIHNKSELISSGVDYQRAIILLEVYHYYGEVKSIASSELLLNNLESFYKIYPIEFNYSDLNANLEYRVKVSTLESHTIDLRIDRIKVELISL